MTGTTSGGSAARDGTFRLLWTGDLAARLGYQLGTFLLPLVVVTVLGGSGVEVGAVSATQFVPVLALSLLVGAWIHRVALRWVLAVANLVRGLAFLVLGAVYAAGGLRLAHLLAAAVLVGAVTVFHDIGVQVTVPRFLSGPKLVSGNGLLQLSTSATQLGGPALAGFLVQRAGISPAAFVTAGLLIVAAGAFAALRAEGLGPRPGGAGVRATIGTGLRFTWSCRPIRDLCVQSALFNLHEQAFVTVFLLFGVRTLGLSSGTVGTLIGLGSIGAVAGSLAAGRGGARLHLGLTLSLCILVASLGFLLVPVLSATGGSTWLLAAGFVVNGAALAGYNVFAVTVRQEIPPDQLLGSVTAGYRITAFGMVPVGALLGGVLADWLGPAAALWTVAVSLTVASLLLFVSPLRRARDMDQARELAGVA